MLYAVCCVSHDHVRPISYHLCRSDISMDFIIRNYCRFICMPSPLDGNNFYGAPPGTQSLGTRTLYTIHTQRAHTNTNTFNWARADGCNVIRSFRIQILISWSRINGLDDRRRCLVDFVYGREMCVLCCISLAIWHPGCLTAFPHSFPFMRPCVQASMRPSIKFEIACTHWHRENKWQERP